MKFREIRRLAYVVREEAERLVRAGDTGNTTGDPRTLEGACGDASKVLAELIGDDAVFEAGAYIGPGDWVGHCWVRLNSGEIVDVTATQFGRRRRVHITHHDESYEVDARGTAAVHRLSSWADVQWRRRLRQAVRRRLR